MSWNLPNVAYDCPAAKRSRVALARVLAVEAPVILRGTSRRLAPIRAPDRRDEEAARGADSGVLVIVVTHDLGLAAGFADTCGASQAAGSQGSLRSIVRKP